MRRSRTAVIAIALGLSAMSPAFAHSPHDVALIVVVSPTFDQDQTILAAIRLTNRNLFARSTDGGRSWNEYATPVLGKGLTALAMSPSHATDGTVFAGTGTTGVWRSLDGGIEWEAVNIGLGNMTVLDVAISPNYGLDGTLLAATNGGLHRSTDGGDTWTLVTTGFTETKISVVSFAPDAPQTVLAGGKVVHRSNDGGLTWVPLQAFANYMDVVTISPDFVVDGTAAVAFGREGNGIFASTDGGLSWGSSRAGLTDPVVNDLAIADDGTVLAVTRTDGFFRADTVLGPWTPFGAGFEEPSDLTSDHFRSLAPSPTFSLDSTVFVAAFEGLFESSDRGETWTQADLYNQRLNRELIPSPDFAQDGTLFAGNYGGGPFSWRDAPDPAAPTAAPDGAVGPLAPSGGSTVQHTSRLAGLVPPTPVQDGWGAHGAGMSSLWSAVLAVSHGFATDRTLFYGHVGFWRSSDAGATWTQLSIPVSIPRAIALSPQFLADQTVFMGSGREGSYVSADAGDTWLALAGGLPAKIRATRIALSPGFPVDPTLYMTSSSDGIWCSTDGGSTWAASSSAIPTDNIRSIAISPDFVSDGLVLAGTAGSGLYRSDDRGDTWVALSDDLTSGADNVIESIAFSPDFAADRTAYVSSLYDGVFRSTDGGQTWSAANTGLPVDATRRIAVSPDFARDDTLFVSTHGWVWRSTNRGATWQVLPGTIRVDNEHPSVMRGGAWGSVQQIGNYGSNVSVHGIPGAWREFVFHGNRITWHASRDSESGIADVLLDGDVVANVDLYSDTAGVMPVFSRTFSETGWHTIRIEVTGTKSAPSAGVSIKSDGFDYSF